MAAGHLAGGQERADMSQELLRYVVLAPTGFCQADGASGIAIDQRNVHRPQGAGCDIGSVEVGQVPQTKDDCKHGGWVNFVDDHGRPFRNQGQCVSFVSARKFSAR
jgi:hypothetical protein